MSKEFYLDELYEVVVYGTGYVKVTNYGGIYAVMKHGEYYIEDHHGKRYPKKTKSQVLEIFKKLIDRYLNFEMNGVVCTYDRGKWKKRRAI